MIRFDPLGFLTCEVLVATVFGKDESDPVVFLIYISTTLLAQPNLPLGFNLKANISTL